MQKNKNINKQDNLKNPFAIDFNCSYPLIEMLGNRKISIEGSTGVLLYERDNIKINTNKMIVSFCGRGLTVNCISNSCVEIEGFVTEIKFVT